MQSDPFMEIFLELAVIDFQINKILNNDFTPTIINRSYAAYLQYDNVELFSNFDMTINNNSLVFSLTDNNFSIHPNSEYILDYNGFLCLEKQLGIVNCFAGGNNNELQLRHSTEIDSFYNKYNKITIDDYPNEYALYPYRHSYAMLSKSFYKLNGYSIDEIVSSEQLVNFPDTGFYVDYPAINEFILKENIGYLDSYKLMDPEISVILVGSMGASSDSYNSITYTMNHIGLPYFKHYAISSFSCIGDALIYGQGSPVFSSVLTKNVDLYDIYSGTSMATPNILGLIGDYVLNLTDTINPFGLKSKVTNYVETSVINFNNICNNDERRLVLMTEPLKNGINTYGLTSLAFDIEKAIYPFNNQVPIKFREFKYRVLIK
jgi:hypothetical protein